MSIADQLAALELYEEVWARIVVSKQAFKRARTIRFPSFCLQDIQALSHAYSLDAALLSQSVEISERIGLRLRRHTDKDRQSLSG